VRILIACLFGFEFGIHCRDELILPDSQLIGQAYSLVGDPCCRRSAQNNLRSSRLFANEHTRARYE
jgi:hypothetical protein